MNKKLFLAGALALSMLTGSVHAEQSAAQDYREMFRAENKARKTGRSNVLPLMTTSAWNGQITRRRHG